MHCKYHHEKWYWEKVQEELEWEDEVARELEEAANAQEPEPAAAD